MLSHFFNSLVATLPLAVRNSGGVAVFVRILWVATLLTMSIGAGIIAAVPLQEIDNAPHAQASAQSNNQRLQSGDRGSEKLHISSISPGLSRP